MCSTMQHLQWCSWCLDCRSRRKKNPLIKKNLIEDKGLLVHLNIFFHSISSQKLPTGNLAHLIGNFVFGRSLSKSNQVFKLIGHWPKMTKSTLTFAQSLISRTKLKCTMINLNEKSAKIDRKSYNSDNNRDKRCLNWKWFNSAWEPGFLEAATLHQRTLIKSKSHYHHSPIYTGFTKLKLTHVSLQDINSTYLYVHVHESEYLPSSELKDTGWMWLSSLPWNNSIMHIYQSGIQLHW